MKNKVIITGMKYEKGKIIITEAKHLDSNNNPTRNVAINEHFAISIKASIIQLDLEHLKEDY